MYFSMQFSASSSYISMYSYFAIHTWIRCDGRSNRNQSIGYSKDVFERGFSRSGNEGDNK